MILLGARRVLCLLLELTYCATVRLPALPPHNPWLPVISTAITFFSSPPPAHSSGCPTNIISDPPSNRGDQAQRGVAWAPGLHLHTESAHHSAPLPSAAPSGTPSSTTDLILGSRSLPSGLLILHLDQLLEHAPHFMDEAFEVIYGQLWRTGHKLLCPLGTYYC